MTRATRTGAVGGFSGGTRAVLYYDVRTRFGRPLLARRGRRHRHGRGRAPGSPVRGGAVVARFGAPTILVNNAGLGSSPSDAALETGRFERYPVSAWDAMMRSHLTSALVASQCFLTVFRASTRQAGSIINISSTYGVVSPDQSMYEGQRRGGREWFKPVGYSVAKAGMLNFTRWLAEYCAHERLGVRVNSLVPGGVQEDGHTPEFIAEYEKRTPLGRMAREDDYNGAVVFLASRASAYMTGATLVVDGGWTAK